jgi:Domain of unknown function (DUF6916)
MRALKLDEFIEREGQSFELRLGDLEIVLTLAKVNALPDSGREGGAFTLDWVGPYEPVLPQGNYSLHHGDSEFEIFMVPIAQERAGTRYEAVFN